MNYFRLFSFKPKYQKHILILLVPNNVLPTIDLTGLYFNLNVDNRDRCLSLMLPVICAFFQICPIDWYVPLPPGKTGKPPGGFYPHRTHSELHLAARAPQGAGLHYPYAGQVASWLLQEGVPSHQQRLRLSPRLLEWWPGLL